ncbi:MULTISPECIES: CvpA family protein [unclassified Undibacterium]|uniref:CvpA family protein n=1 Tax=unclassified Undibacterium TaxID=2630295 RepID=UPI002AC96B5F|nr:MULTISPECIES: CvpA family protein [unclassified Undibacterium]MEB0138457.1 CvpA family protein [Undibacterium sp. CCC2.1]MEB0173142.1 CvpA family protein [Undibacterium sp. CCC1.1]MEB0177533.1 CvpA family protein [Undibacterium sp. CCC3.4]MEB0216151.1 CvpA family protein [Undibacterium sp. 5I2]WPX42800.1 CvpA family protein [Undibacterium sp. CCC3.4]
MTLFDYIVLLILLCSVVISTMRGLIKEILSLVSWIVAFVLANAYSELVSAWLPAVFPGQIVRLIVAFLALFIGVRLLMALVMRAVDAIIKASGMSLADSGLGGIFGLARGCVLVLAAVLVCGMTAIPQQAFWKNALLSPLAETAAQTVIPFLPASISGHVRF